MGWTIRRVRSHSTVCGRPVTGQIQCVKDISSDHSHRSPSACRRLQMIRQDPLEASLKANVPSSVRYLSERKKEVSPRQSTIGCFKVGSDSNPERRKFRRLHKATRPAKHNSNASTTALYRQLFGWRTEDEERLMCVVGKWHLPSQLL